MNRIVFACVLSMLFFTGCRSIGGGIILSGSSLPGHYSPPAHAPAYGHRQQHRYHYYPNAEIYFDTRSNVYFYLDSRSIWTYSVHLPVHLRHHLHDNYVEIEMDEARPYRRHHHYRNRYSKHKTKYKRKHRKKHKIRLHGNEGKKVMRILKKGLLF